MNFYLVRARNLSTRTREVFDERFEGLEYPVVLPRGWWYNFDGDDSHVRYFQYHLKPRTFFPQEHEFVYDIDFGIGDFIWGTGTDAIYAGPRYKFYFYVSIIAFRNGIVSEKSRSLTNHTGNNSVEYFNIHTDIDFDE